MIVAAFPCFVVGLGLEDGHIETFQLLLHVLKTATVLRLWYGPTHKTHAWDLGDPKPT